MVLLAIRLSEAMAKKGIYSLAWYDGGRSLLFNNTSKPISNASGYERREVRVMNTSLCWHGCRLIGVMRTPRRISEVYNPLKKRVWWMAPKITGLLMIQVTTLEGRTLLLAD